jgi:hypothetical protein
MITAVALDNLVYHLYTRINQKTRQEKLGANTTLDLARRIAIGGMSRTSRQARLSSG